VRTIFFICGPTQFFPARPASYFPWFPVATAWPLRKTRPPHSRLSLSPPHFFLRFPFIRGFYRRESGPRLASQGWLSSRFLTTLPESFPFPGPLFFDATYRPIRWRNFPFGSHYGRPPPLRNVSVPLLWRFPSQILPPSAFFCLQERLCNIARVRRLLRIGSIPLVAAHPFDEANSRPLPQIFLRPSVSLRQSLVLI